MLVFGRRRGPLMAVARLPFPQLSTIPSSSIQQFHSIIPTIDPMEENFGTERRMRTPPFAASALSASLRLAQKSRRPFGQSSILAFRQFSSLAQKAISLQQKRGIATQSGTAAEPLRSAAASSIGAVVVEASITDLVDMRDAIYCGGSLLAAVQQGRLFPDCKHFVDMPLKIDAETTLADWANLLAEAARTGNPLGADLLHAFIDAHFDQPGGELEDHHPDDFNSEHRGYDQILDPDYRQWALQLHAKWPTLCRRVSERVQSEPHRYSLIPVPKPFVVPGGRFREMYYWDSFFTIKGLLASGMFATVRGMIENMGDLIERFGFVPNGNRIYYLNRSQPPLLTWCVHAYYKATHDTEFVRSAMPWLRREMDFFMNNKLIHQPGWKSHLFRYHVVATGPRPESYREDVESAEHILDEMEKNRLYGDIAAAAESGRDFSSRWFHNVGPQAGKMGSTRTSQIIPVDLNAIICGNWKLFGELYTALGEDAAASEAMVHYELMREAIHQVFWNEEAGSWFDYDLSEDRQTPTFFDTNLFPLFTSCAHKDFDGKRIVDYLAAVGVLTFPGGVPTSLITSGQQWDFPSGWAPTNWVIIEGLRAYGQQELARCLAEKWIRKNYLIWKNSGGRMYEKYNVASECLKTMGGGGEYEVQEGFGWTNGVILDLLSTYSTDLQFSNATPSHSACECCRSHGTIVTATAPLDSSVMHLELPQQMVAQLAAATAVAAAELAAVEPMHPLTEPTAMPIVPPAEVH